MLFEILFVFSFILNLFLLLYSVRLARRIIVIGSNLQTLYDAVDLFKQHVSIVHESEMFYGDQTLQDLIEHSTSVLDTLESYDDVMALVVEEDDFDEEEEIGKEE